MTFHACSREEEVRESLQRGQWPDGCGEELRSHVEGCRRCDDVVLVSLALRGQRSEAEKTAPVIAAGPLWWRAQLRRRNAAVERMAKPIRVAQIFALTVNLVAAVGFLVWQARHGVRWMAWFTGEGRGFHAAGQGWSLSSEWLMAAMRPEGSLTLVIAVVGSLALLSGVAVYLATERQ
jgi:hypothetical protein